MQNEQQATRRIGSWALVGALVVAALFGVWLIFSPTDRTLESAKQPSPTASENTGRSGGVPNPPASPAPTPDQNPAAQGQGGAGADSTRGTNGPTNPPQVR
jgi:hypothetical protein